MKTICIVQARMNSKRLPNKMMLQLRGVPIIGWVNQRLRRSKRIDKLIFAIPNTNSDDVLASYLEAQNSLVFRGDENDVLKRFYDVCIANPTDAVIRVCADNPFVDPCEVDYLVDFFRIGKYDYAYNHIPVNNSYPDGLGAEIVTFSVLKKLHSLATLSNHREHIFNYIWDNPNAFKIATCNPLDKSIASPHLKLDVDTLEDFNKMNMLRLTPSSSAFEVVQAALRNNETTFSN